MTPEEQAVITTGLDLYRAEVAMDQAFSLSKKREYGPWTEPEVLEHRRTESAWNRARDAHSKAITKLGQAHEVTA